MQNPTHLRIPRELKQGESEKAYCFNIDGQKVWLPKSQIRDFEEINECFDFWMPEWLVVQNKIEHFIDTSFMPTLF